MKYVYSEDIFNYYLKGTGQWGVYVVVGDPEEGKPDHADTLWGQLKKAYGTKNTGALNELTRVLTGSSYFVFPDEQSARKFYDVLDQEEIYNYSVYASLHCPVHGTLTENT